MRLETVMVSADYGFTQNSNAIFKNMRTTIKVTYSKVGQHSCEASVMIQVNYSPYAVVVMSNLVYF